MTRRERAIAKVFEPMEDVTPARIALQAVATATLDAYEAELAADLESEETVQRISEMLWGRFPKQPPYVSEAQTRLVRAALRTVLEDR